MAAKTTSLVGIGLSTISFLAWSGFAFQDNYEYNSKMKKYEEWRGKFFNKKDPSIQGLICENKSKGECLNGKEYFPKPYENDLWEKAYQDYKNRYSDNPYKIRDLEEWKSYCYGEIKKDNNGQGSFNPSGQTPGHEYCVVGV